MTEVPYCKNLAQEWKLGDLVIKNRVAMASMTRNRDIVPSQATVDYYTQRASAGIIMTEGILVEPQGSEWPDAPGLVTEEQVAGWTRVVESVHKKGGIIFAQLWHLGRAANAQMNNGEPPLAPSAIPAQGVPFASLLVSLGTQYQKPLRTLVT
ncbi:hypothetical protein DSO57_1019707 [Entomophthora muscae]|uniref:Uncharacterized protein n=2 Tax=Entomophthora muscae TaxID=34485 RepID=A0ACC2TRY7_9FUNG|nr:hypothetical protein DSO57_1019697 [Entomophthora muscae]KAJ9077126.1 hypothetical protein DSO57_1019707 [Entomophthora muscae]